MVYVLVPTSLSKVQADRTDFFYFAASALVGGQREVTRIGLSYWYLTEEYKELCYMHKTEWASTFWQLFDAYSKFIAADSAASFFGKQPDYISGLDCWKAIKRS